MTLNKRQLQEIIDNNSEAAELGCDRSKGMVIMAQSELDEIANQERLNWWACSNRWEDESERNWKSEERNWGVEKG